MTDNNGRHTLNLSYYLITPNVSELCPHCTVAIIIWPYIIIDFFCCDTSLLQINCCSTSLLPIMSCYASFLVLYCFFSCVCWCCVVCVSPLFLLIVAIFGYFADFAHPLTSKWCYLLGHTTPFSFHCYCASRKYNYESGTSCIFKLILNYATGNHL